MTTFYNLALKTETSSAKRVVASIWETWNATDVNVCSFYLFWDKKTKNMQRKNLQWKTKIIQTESNIRSIS